MNTLINTPFLKTTPLKTEFDNKIILIFLAIIVILIIVGILFIDVMKSIPNSGGIN